MYRCRRRNSRVEGRRNVQGEEETHGQNQKLNSPNSFVMVVLILSFTLVVSAQFCNDLFLPIFLADEIFEAIRTLNDISISQALVRYQTLPNGLPKKTSCSQTGE